MSEKLSDSPQKSYVNEGALSDALEEKGDATPKESQPAEVPVTQSDSSQQAPKPHPQQRQLPQPPSDINQPPSNPHQPPSNPHQPASNPHQHPSNPHQPGHQPTPQSMQQPFSNLQPQYDNFHQQPNPQHPPHLQQSNAEYDVYRPYPPTQPPYYNQPQHSSPPPPDLTTQQAPPTDPPQNELAYDRARYLKSSQGCLAVIRLALFVGLLITAAFIKSALGRSYSPSADYAVALAFIGLLCEAVVFTFTLVRIGQPSVADWISNPHHTMPIILLVYHSVLMLMTFASSLTATSSYAAVTAYLALTIMIQICLGIQLHLNAMWLKYGHSRELSPLCQ